MEKSPEKLTIAVALTYLTGVSGGAERIAIETANELSKRGHAVTIISCHGLAGEPYYSLNRKIPYIDLAIHPYKQHYENLGKNLNFSFEDIAGRCFERLDYAPKKEDFEQWCQSGHLWLSQMYHGFFQEHSFDVVISHMPSTFPYVLLGRKEEDKTIHIASLHNAPSFKFYSDLYPADNLMDRYMRLLALEKADFISLLFEEYQDQMPQAYSEKCFTLPDFTSIKQKEQNQRKQPSKIILSIGRLVRQKNHATLLRSYAKVKKNYPDWELHIYGEGPLREELAELCDELGLSFKNIFKGIRQDIETVYQAADIFAFPSLFEGFGLTLVEAMAFGLPSVGFADCEGVKYLINHETNGLLVSRENQNDSMAEAIIHLIKSPELRSALGKQAMKTAKLHNLEESVDTLERKIAPFFKDHSNISAQKVNKSSDMSVAIVATYLEGGAGIAAKRLQKGLVQAGVTAHTLSFSPTKEEHGIQTELTLPARAVLSCFQPFSAEVNRVPGSTIFSPSYPSLTTDQLSSLDDADVINIHWVQTILSSEAITYLANLGKPLVWTMHDMNPFTGGCHYTAGCENYQTDCRNCPQLIDTFDNFPAKVLAAKKRHWPENIILVSPSRWLAECARNSAVFKNHRIEVIPNSLDTGIFKPIPKKEARRQLNLPEGDKILLFASCNHRERRKGFKELIHASELLKKHKQTYRIVTFGEESAEISKLGLPYTSLGLVTEEEILALGYNAADVTVLPTLEDNLPNTILESVACGTPVVAFDSGGVGDAVICGVTGYLVRQGDIEALANKIEQAACEDFRDRCRNYALKEFSLEVQANRYKSLFEELISLPNTTRNYVVQEFFPETAPEVTRLLAAELASLQTEIRNISAQANQPKEEKPQPQIRQHNVQCTDILEDIEYVNQSTNDEIKIVSARLMQRIKDESLTNKPETILVEEVSSQLGQLSALVNLADKTISALQAELNPNGETSPHRVTSSGHEKESMLFTAYQIGGKGNLLPVERYNDLSCCWSGADPEIHFTFPLDRGTKLKMEIRLIALIKPEYSKKLKILIDDKHIKHSFRRDGSLFTVSCVLPLSERTTQTDVKIILPATHSPRDLGHSSDERKLGIAINEIRFGKPTSSISRLLMRLKLKK